MTFDTQKYMLGVAFTMCVCVIYTVSLCCDSFKMLCNDGHRNENLMNGTFLSLIDDFIKSIWIG